LIRALVTSLVTHGRIKTTLAKAKELRRHAEKAITLGKKETLASRRLLMARYPYPGAIEGIMTWVPVFKSRPGGFTRITKIGKRPGDSAEVAYIEFLDYEKVLAGKSAGSDSKSVKKAAKKPANADTKPAKTTAKKAKAKA
jgi:large subunit ribosomal protein L17